MGGTTRLADVASRSGWDVSHRKLPFEATQTARAAFVAPWVSERVDTHGLRVPAPAAVA